MRKYRGRQGSQWKRPPKRLSPRRGPPAFVLFLLVFAGTIAVTQGYLSGWFEGVSGRPLALVSAAIAETSETTAPSKRQSFSFCHTGGGYNCVVDGDTIWLAGVKIRLADIDTPETHDYRCQAEKDLGDRATVRLREILQSGSISLKAIDRDADQYGRKLRIVLVDGESAGETLVGEGLARWYADGRRPWC
ncbi:thermonuclease family protein [Sphingopyxis indica]|uniref:thermonuclease family protein n=1 Tax=Sphingopyxis indica TaxID=436663 RepID=UPI00293933CC|nr:thermonuclease family protein [Sphingopyxis indica]WOF41722.1 thermonuclease family protein [Sphingopyxis indica]